MRDRGLADRAVPVRQARDPDARRKRRAAARLRRDRGRRAAQPARTSTSKVPLGVFCCVTGVSGSGKSTLVNEVLLQGGRQPAAPRQAAARARTGASAGSTQVDKVINIDQSPIGRTPRSNPATYIGLFDHIRELFSQHAGGAGARLQAGPLLLQRQGRALRGLPRRRPDQDRDALPARRLRAVRAVPRQALQPRDARGALQGQDDRRRARHDGRGGARLLRAHPEDQAPAAGAARRRARLHPARPARDDAVRRRGAAREAGRRAVQGRDRAARSTSSTSPRPACTSPTSSGCWRCCDRLVEQGNTVVVIEHNLDVIKTADRIIDLGPEGGEEGGQLVAQGTPEQVAATAGSHTGSFLAAIVEPPERQRGHARRSRRRPRRGGGLRRAAALAGAAQLAHRLDDLHAAARPTATSIRVGASPLSAIPIEQVTGGRDAAPAGVEHVLEALLPVGARSASVACSRTENSSAPVRAISSTPRTVWRSTSAVVRSRWVPTAAPWTLVDRCRGRRGPAPRRPATRSYARGAAPRERAARRTLRPPGGRRADP